MVIKKPEAKNLNQAADDMLGYCLNYYSNVKEATPDQVATFALLYIADKFDSLDTRLFHLVNQVIDQERRHE